MRPMSEAYEAALTREIIYPIYFFEIGFANDTVRLWTGFGDREWDDQTWQGVGWILGMSEVDETAETRASSFTIGTISNAEVNARFLLHFRKNKPATIWQGLLSPDDPSQLIDAPLVIASGLTDIYEIDTDTSKPAIRINCESRIADLERARTRRYTHEDHQIDWPGDLFFQYVGQLSDKILNWGQTT